MEKINTLVHLNVEEFIKKWNTLYPYDRWWRKKYNLPFGSEKHRQASFIEMVIEYKEDKFFQSLATENNENSDLESEVDRMIGLEQEGQNSAPKLVKMTKSEIDDEFDNIDPDEFN